MMIPREHTFQTSAPVEVAIDNPTGEVRVTASGQDRVEVRLTPLGDDGATRQAIEEAAVEFASGRLRVKLDYSGLFGRRALRRARVQVAVTVPDGSSLWVSTVAADIQVTGRVDALDVNSTSGDVAAENVDGEVRVNTVSGDVSARTVTAEARVTTVSGGIRLGQVGALGAQSASGDIRVTEVSGSAQVQTVSGDLTLDRVGQGDLTLTTTSGDVRLGVPEGTVAHLSINTLSGAVRNELPVEDSAPDTGAQLRISARTLSGDVTIGRAASAQRR